MYYLTDFKHFVSNFPSFSIQLTPFSINLNFFDPPFLQKFRSDWVHFFFMCCTRVPKMWDSWQVMHPWSIVFQVHDFSDIFGRINITDITTTLTIPTVIPLMTLTRQWLGKPLWWIISFIMSLGNQLTSFSAHNLYRGGGTSPKCLVAVFSTQTLRPNQI